MRDADRKLLDKLKRLYPEPKSELNFRSEFELITAVILSAQCTDKKVNEVTPALFKSYPDFESLSIAKITAVEAIIRPVNFYKSKARNIVGMAKAVCERHHGKLPRHRSDLEALPGVGRKTASVVLSQLGIEPALPVDTHVFRVARRLGLSNAEKRDLVEEELRKRFHPKMWHDLHHWLIFHGRRVCKALRPQCDVCALASLCPSCKIEGSKK